MTKSVSRAAAQKKRNANPKTASKGTAKVGNRHRKPAAKVAAELVRDTHRKTTALFEQFPGTQVPDTSASLPKGTWLIRASCMRVRRILSKPYWRAGEIIRRGWSGCRGAQS